MNEFLRAIYEEKLMMSEAELLQIAKDNGFDLYSQDYRVLVVASVNRVEGSKGYRQYCLEMPSRCRCYLSRKGIRAELLSDCSGKCIILLMEKATNREIEGIANGLLVDLDTHSIPETVVAVGKRVLSIDKVSYAYRTAINALNYRSMYSGERCLFCDDMQVMLNLSTLQSVIDPNLMLQAFQADDIEKLRLLVTLYAEKVRTLSGVSIEGRHPTSIRRMFVELTVYVLHIASDMGIDVDAIFGEIDPYNFLLAEAQSTPMIIDWFIGMCSELRKAINEKAHSKEKKVVQQVCTYIDQNITRSDLSLDDAAAIVNMTPSYISKLFRKEKGIGFSKFVVHSRLQIASDMLINTELSVKEISELSGFASANYFGIVFKREYGTSPQMYRLQRTDKQE